MRVGRSRAWRPPETGPPDAVEILGLDPASPLPPATVRRARRNGGGPCALGARALGGRLRPDRLTQSKYSGSTRLLHCLQRPSAGPDEMVADHARWALARLEAAGERT